MDYILLEKSALFRGLTAAEIEKLLGTVYCTLQSYGREETVFMAMEEAALTGVVLTGRIQARKLFPHGSQVDVSVLEPGDLLAPAAAFTQSRRYPCELVAMEPTEALLLRREELLRLFKADVRLAENYLCELASAAYALQQRLELFSYSGIAQKAAYYLLTRSQQTGKTTIPIPESVTRWALMMNVSRPSLHRELKKLEAQGLIGYKPPFIEILDAAGLQALLNTGKGR